MQPLNRLARGCLYWVGHADKAGRFAIDRYEHDSLSQGLIIICC